MAARPSAIAKWVLPTPGGPRSRSASPCATQRQAASSRIWRGSSEGWAAKSKPSRSRARKVGDLARHLDAPLVLARDLALDQEGERLAQGHFAARRLVNQIVELVADRGELEPGQPADESLVIASQSGAIRLRTRRRRRGAAADGHRQPPPTRRSYSARGLGSADDGSAAGSAPAGRAAPATPWKCAGSTIRCRR